MYAKYITSVVYEIYMAFQLYPVRYLFIVIILL